MCFDLLVAPVQLLMYACGCACVQLTAMCFENYRKIDFRELIGQPWVKQKYDM